MKLRYALAVLAAVPILHAAVPTYNKDIAPILYDQCALCHRPGEVAPFSLLTYQDAAKRAPVLAAVTKSRFMPPWKPEPGFGKFQHERRLTDAQIALIADWAKGGAPEGDTKDKPTPPVFSNGWQAGEPSLVLKTGDGFAVAADGPDQFRCFVLPLNLDHDAYVSSTEFRPGNRRVVHHALIYMDTSGEGRKRAASSKDGSYPCFGGPGVSATGIAGGWAPGSVAQAGDPSLSLLMKKGTDLIVQLHYHPWGKAETDVSSVGLKFSNTPATKGRTVLLLGSTAIDIPPGDAHYVVKSSLELPRDADITGVTPHAHYLCKDMKVDAHLPSGEVTHLIWIKDWDFNWQGGYRFVAPLHLPKGTRIDMEYTYDNSEANPRNPSHPARRVTYGEETVDEMALAFLSVVLPSNDDVAEFQKEMRFSYIVEIVNGISDLSHLPARVTDRLATAIKLFDRNHDGKLDDSERAALIEFLRKNMQ